MATFKWSGVSGSYTAADWTITGPSAGVAPGTSDIAILGGTGAYTVTVAHPLSSFTVPLGHNVTLDNPNATLNFESSSGLTTYIPNVFQINAGTLNMTGTAGQIIISSTSMNNNGTINSAGLGIYSVMLLSSLRNTGLIFVDGDTLQFGFVAANNAGTVSVADFGTVKFGISASNTGTITLASGGSVVLTDGLQNNATTAGTVAFLDDGGSVLTIQHLYNNNFTSTISGFRPGDTIDLLTAVQYSTTETIGYIDGNIVISASGVPAYHIPAVNLAPGAHLEIGPDSFGWAQITMAACFAEGTRIATARGPVALEALRVGDMIVAPDGSSSAAIWVGHRHVDCRRHPKPQDVWPVKVEAHAFGAGLPLHDLFLSPDHSVFTGGALIPVRYLVNGRTIAQVPRAAVTYWHVELPRHGILLAEGLPCESYLDTGNRSAFAGGGPVLQLHPEFARQVWQREGYAPLILEGPLLHRIRAGLVAQAEALGHVRTEAADMRLELGGATLRPRRRGDAYSFALPPGERIVRLRSRSAAPAETRGTSDDCRRLGVAVRGIAFDGEPADLADTRLGTGWHAVEFEGSKPVWRWTDGAAEIDVRGARRVQIAVAMSMHYWKSAAHSPAAAASR